MKIIDAHAHLCLKQNAVWDDKTIQTTTKDNFYYLHKKS